MFIDIFFAALFAAILFRARLGVRAGIFLLAGAASEIFSTLPFGVSMFILALCVFTTEKLRNVFDETSFVSFLASFIGGLGAYLLLLGFARFWFFGGDVFQHTLRTGIQYVRSAVFISLFLACFMIIRFGGRSIYYAFVEEKTKSI